MQFIQLHRHFQTYVSFLSFIIFMSYLVSICISFGSGGAVQIAVQIASQKKNLRILLVIHTGHRDEMNFSFSSRFSKFWSDYIRTATTAGWLLNNQNVRSVIQCGPILFLLKKYFSLQRSLVIFPTLKSEINAHKMRAPIKWARKFKVIGLNHKPINRKLSPRKSVKICPLTDTYCVTFLPHPLRNASWLLSLIPEASKLVMRKIKFNEGNYIDIFYFEVRRPFMKALHRRASFASSDQIVWLHPFLFAKFYKMGRNFEKQTSQELRMLFTVTLNCQVTKIVINSGSQLSQKSQFSRIDLCRNCERTLPHTIVSAKSLQLTIVCDNVRS